MGRRARTVVRSRRSRDASPPGGEWHPELVPRPRAVRRRAADSDAKLDERIERVTAALYALYTDLQYFVASSADQRERLRRRVSWPDVGHITSLARALAEEDRFSEWVRFNRYMVKVA